MRHLVIIFMLFLFVAEAVAQDQTPQQSTNGRGYFGAPVIKYTVVRDQESVMFGGRGGWNLTSSLILGAGLYATMSEVHAREGAVPKGGPNVSGLLDVKFESFGFDLEYAVHPSAPAHLTLNIFFGGAAVRYVTDNAGEQQGETNIILLLEPSVGVELKITNGLHLILAVSNRQVSGVEQPGLNNRDFNSAAVTLAFKFGRF